MQKIFLFLLLFIAQLNATKIGSEDSVALSDSHIQFVESDNDSGVDPNQILGFAYIKDGFSFENNSTTATFDGFFPVSGNIGINGGNLILSRNLNLASPSIITSMGNITGNDNLLDISYTNTFLSFDASGNIIDGLKLSYDTDLTISGTVYFQGNNIISGNGQKLVLDDSANIIVMPNSSLHIKNIVLDNISGNNVRCLDDSSKLILDNIVWQQTGNYSFTKGTFEVSQKVIFAGKYTFSYEACFSSTVQRSSKLHITDGMFFSMGRKHVDGVNPIYFEDVTAILDLENCTFNITSSGICIDRGTFMFDQDVYISLNSSDTSNGIILGDGFTPEGCFEFNPGAEVIFSAGHVIFDTIVPKSVHSRAVSTKMVRHPGSIFEIRRPVELSKISIESSPLSTLNIDEDAHVKYNGTKIVGSDWDFDFTGSAYNAYTLLLDGSDDMFFSKGTLPLNVLVNGTGNKVLGTGNIGGSVTLSNSSSDLLSSLDGVFLSDISLNGGTLFLSGPTRLSKNAIFRDEGNIYLYSYDLSFGFKDLSSTGSFNFFGSGGSLNLHSNLDLFGTWTFNGNCTINGNGKKINFESGNIVVDPDSTLIFKDIKISGIRSNNLRCLSNSSSLVLDDVSWIQEGDYSFTVGSMSINNDVMFSGGYTFSYDSYVTSTVEYKSRWHITGDLNLISGRKETIEPFYFNDHTAVIKLENCTFSSTPSGFKIDRGTFEFDKDVLVSVNSTDTNTGIILGDGLTPEGTFEFNPGAKIIFGSGHIVFDTMTPGALVSRSKDTKIVRNAGSIFHVKRPVILSEMTVDTDPSTGLTIDDGARVEYNKVSIVGSDWDFDLTGTAYNIYTLLLDGDDSIFFSKGTFPLFTLVNGVGNKIHGSGNIGGSITFQNSSAELTISLNGELLSDINLNGGKAIAGQDIRFSCKKMFVGPGTVDLNGNRISLSNKDATFSSPIYWDAGNGGAMSINSKITLSNTWTVSSNMTFNGKGNVVDFESTGGISVEDGSSLRIKNAILNNLSGEKIKCLGDNSSIVFEHVTWIQDDDFTFDKGSFEIHENVKMKGNYKFAYATKGTSTIDRDSILYLDKGFTFSYDPKITSKELIKFTDDTSLMYLDSATLHTTATGMQLTSGRLIIKGNSILESESYSYSTTYTIEKEAFDLTFVNTLTITTVIDEGISFGDSTSTNDMLVEIRPGAHLCINQGFLANKNVNNSSMNVMDNFSTIIFQPNTALKLYENLSLTNGSVVFESDSYLYKVSGKSIFGETRMNGSLYHKVLS